MMEHGFELQLDEELKRLFRESSKVVVKAWAPEELKVPKYFAFEGTLSDGAQPTLVYGECGPKKLTDWFEHGKLIIEDIALRAVRYFLESAESQVYIYAGVYIRIDRELPPGKEEIRVDDILVRFSFSSSGRTGELVLHGFGDKSVLRAITTPPLAEWRIYFDKRKIYHGELHYIGVDESVLRVMPAWLERAFDE
jgi:hypothetical protein